MQFGLLEMGPPYGPIAWLSICYAILGVFIMVYMFTTFFNGYCHIRRQLWLLVEPILAQIIKGDWEPSALVFPDANDLQLSVYAVALRKELAGQSPIAIIGSLNKTINLLGRRLEQMIFYSRLLGWSICSVGVIGALSHTWNPLRAGFYMKDYPLGAVAGAISEGVVLLMIELFIGLICIAGSYFSQSRLSSLKLAVSDRILNSVEERTAQELKNGTVKLKGPLG